MRIIKKLTRVYNRKRGYKKGFVLLFAVTLVAIFLSIALGVAQVALREINFGTSAKDANNAFFAADTGAEQALFNDKDETGSNYCAPAADPGGITSCTITVTGLGSDGASCAITTTTKENDVSFPTVATTIISDGYNMGSDSSNHTCTSTSVNRVERELETNY